MREIQQSTLSIGNSSPIDILLQVRDSASLPCSTSEEAQDASCLAPNVCLLPSGSCVGALGAYLWHTFDVVRSREHAAARGKFEARRAWAREFIQGLRGSFCSHSLPCIANANEPMSRMHPAFVALDGLPLALAWSAYVHLQRLSCLQADSTCGALLQSARAHS